MNVVPRGIFLILLLLQGSMLLSLTTEQQGEVPTVPSQVFVYTEPFSFRTEFMVPAKVLSKVQACDLNQDDWLDPQEIREATESMEPLVEAMFHVIPLSPNIVPGKRSLVFFDALAPMTIEDTTEKSIPMSSAAVGLIQSFGIRQGRVANFSMSYTPLIPTISEIPVRILEADGTELIRILRGQQEPFSIELQIPQSFELPHGAVSSREVCESEREFADLFRKLIENVYTSFLLNDDEAIHDSISQTVAGGLLRTIYLDVRKSLYLQQREKSLATVEKVDVMECRLLDTERGRKTALVTWKISGAVEHWGHVHRRTNQFVARATIESMDANWKLTELAITESRRVLDETSAREERR